MAEEQNGPLKDEEILKGVERYYTEKVTAHGATSLGVDWNSKESQYLRFEQLCKVLPATGHMDVLDFGCGYGELVNYLDTLNREASFNYQGFDLSQEMIVRAEAAFKGRQGVGFSTVPAKDGSAEFAIASGLFNVKPDGVTSDAWHAYMISTLRQLDRMSTKGFAFNALTKYSDAERMKAYLHYSDPCALFDLCKREFSRNVALLHDYDLYEFTMIIRK